jgi:hypothetical protein
MLTKAFVTAAAAGLLTASAAYAGEHMNQTAEHMDTTSASASTTVNPTTSTWNSSGSTWNTSGPALSADIGLSSDVSATVPMSTADALAAGGTVQIITSTPVADTPQNRALYGQPMSMSGKRTRPAGN